MYINNVKSPIDVIICQRLLTHNALVALEGATNTTLTCRSHATNQSNKKVLSAFCQHKLKSRPSLLLLSVTSCSHFTIRRSSFYSVCFRSSMCRCFCPIIVATRGRRCTNDTANLFSLNKEETSWQTGGKKMST